MTYLGSDLREIRRSRRRSPETADRSEELGQRLSDIPQSREIRRNSESGRVRACRAERSEGALRQQTEQKELGERLSDSPPIREIRRSSETADRAEGARRAVE
jgi:hypothetical protein